MITILLPAVAPFLGCAEMGAAQNFLPESRRFSGAMVAADKRERAIDAVPFYKLAQVSRLRRLIANKLSNETQFQPSWHNAPGSAGRSSRGFSGMFYPNMSGGRDLRPSSLGSPRLAIIALSASRRKSQSAVWRSPRLAIVAL